ncbi:Transmembrane amino acid transporter family protein [Striga hermonthica]|uniref:Transmembrane amino acid transporter family protein n=1 Tax=Striga hermonthica TaxID=68872 RepID=A0A9N7NGI4_STRHE|nr:Transmembrane amino acid transporter family protein [Striga hermonthica]
MKLDVEAQETSIVLPLLAGGGYGGRPLPAEEDDRRQSTSFFKTCFNGLNALSGVGILSMPYAVSSAGWSSLIFFFLIASCTFYTGVLIKRCMDVDPAIRSYPDIGERAFGPKGRTFVSVAMNLELYLVATGFLILEGDNLHNLFPQVGFEFGGLSIGGKQTFILIVGLILMPAVWLDNMNILSYISATGVVASFVLVGSILWVGTSDDIGFHERGSVINARGIPTAVSLYAFCYCAHPVFPTLYTSMKNQKKFSEVLLVCFLVCTMSYASMAIMGYLMFGSNVQSQITLNLPTNKISSRVAIYTTLVNPLAKYTLMVTPIVNALETRILNASRSKGLSTSIRSGLVFSTIVVAVAIPFFEDLMSLVGAFLSVTASIILPCLCFLKIMGDYQRPRLESAGIWGILLMGIVVLVVGTFTALREIYNHLVI